MEVIPVPPTDQQKPIHNIRTRTFFIFDTRLSESTLQSGLDNLIRNHWRKLGGRLVKAPHNKNNKNGGLLEYHVPKTFDDDSDYKLFEWSAREFDHGIDKSAPLAIFHDPPLAEKGVTLLHSVEEVDKIVRPASWPLEVKDEHPSGKVPLLHVHLSLFSDATVLALSIPHVVADQMGVRNIMRAWFRLTYHNESPPEMTGYTEDVLLSTTERKNYTDWPKHEIYRKGHSRVRNKFEYFFVVLGFIPDFITDRTDESHIVFFPRPVLEGLRERYRKELMAEYGVDPGLSLGDIINAVLTKFHRMHKKKSQTITLSQLVNLRNRHPTLLPPSKSYSYIHNGLHYVSTRFRISATTPIREIAYKNRQAITTYSTPQNYEIGLAVMREQVRRGQGTHVCEPFEKSYFVTNWCLAWKGLEENLVPTDTKGSEKNEKEKEDEYTKEGKKEKLKTKMMVIGRSMETKTSSRFNATIMCQTPEGFWCDFAAPEKAFKLIEEYLKTDPMLENF